MEDYEFNWDKYKTSPVRQFDLIIRDIAATLEAKGKDVAKEYMRGLVDGNRFARECPKMEKLENEE